MQENINIKCKRVCVLVICLPMYVSIYSNYRQKISKFITQSQKKSAKALNNYQKKTKVYKTKDGQKRTNQTKEMLLRVPGG